MTRSLHLVYLYSLLLLFFLLTACLPMQTSPAESVAESPSAEQAPAAAPQVSRPIDPPRTEAGPTPTIARQITAIPTATSTPVAIGPAVPGVAENVVVVGQTDLGGRGWHGGLALMRECVYVGNRRARSLTIVDVADPTAPALFSAVPLALSDEPVELRTVPEAELLVVADVEEPLLWLFDVSDCRQPRLLSRTRLPAPMHEFYLWRDGAHLLLFGATFGRGADLLVYDISEPTMPARVTTWSGSAIGLPGSLHSVTVSADGSRAYLALWNGGIAIAELALPTVHVLGMGDPGTPIFWFPNAHSAVPLNDPRYLLVTSEIYGCPFGGLVIVDIVDPARPRLVSSFRLPENRCQNLPAPPPVFTAHNPLLVGDLVLISWYAGGLQILDLSDPGQPRRVGQYVPADSGSGLTTYVGSYPVQTWSYPILRDGLIYVADIQSGLHILRYTGEKAELLAAVARAEGNMTVAGPERQVR